MAIFYLVGLWYCSMDNRGLLCMNEAVTITPLVQLLIDNSLTLQWIFGACILLIALYLMFRGIHRELGDSGDHKP